MTISEIMRGFTGLQLAPPAAYAAFTLVVVFSVVALRLISNKLPSKAPPVFEGLPFIGGIIKFAQVRPFDALIFAEEAAHPARSRCCDAADFQSASLTSNRKCCIPDGCTMRNSAAHEQRLLGPGNVSGMTLSRVCLDQSSKLCLQVPPQAVSSGKHRCCRGPCA